MADVLIDEQNMIDIADSIRSQLGTEDTYLPSEMAAAIMSIEGEGGSDLPEVTEEDNGKVLKVIDGEWGKGNDSTSSTMNYSTEEQIVGTWIDGKPLYQKTIDYHIEIPQANNWYEYFDVASLNIENIISYQSKPGASNASSLTGVYILNGKLMVISPIAWALSYLTIQYTKTTDSSTSTQEEI